MRGARVVRAAIRAHGGQHSSTHPTAGVGQGGGRALALQTHQFSSSGAFRKDSLIVVHGLGNSASLDTRRTSSSLDGPDSIAEFPLDWVPSDPVFPETQVPEDAQPAIVALDDSWNDDDSLFSPIASQEPAPLEPSWLPPSPLPGSESPLKPRFSEFMDQPFSIDGADFSSWMACDADSAPRFGLWEHQPSERRTLSPAELFPSIFLDWSMDCSEPEATAEYDDAMVPEVGVDSSCECAPQPTCNDSTRPWSAAPADPTAFQPCFAAPNLHTALFSSAETSSPLPSSTDPVFPSRSTSLAALASADSLSGPASSPSTACQSPYSQSSQSNSLECSSPSTMTSRSASPETSPKPKRSSGPCELRFPCEHPGCGRSYSTKGNLTQHMKSCHDPNPKRFSCPMCPKQFVKKSGVREHVRRIHDQESYVREFLCELCGKGFTKRYNMTRHVRACPMAGARSGSRAAARRRQQQQA